MSADPHLESDELDPDEPRTPMWLPLLGGALFLAALMLFLVTRSDEDSPDEAGTGDLAAEPASGEAEPATDTAEGKEGSPAPARARPRGAAPPADPRPGAPEPAAGEPDKFQRQPGDEHYGHDHP